MGMRNFAKLVLLLLILSLVRVEILQAQTLRVPYVSISPTHGPLWNAVEAGLFKKQNLDVEIVYMPGGSLIIQAMLGGDVKVANMAAPAAIGAWVKGAKLALVGSGINRLLETVMTRPNIKTPQDLKGKTIGVSRFGGLTDVGLRAALQYYNIKPDQDVTIVQAGGEASRLAGLQTGALDGAMLSGDLMFQAEKLGFHVVIDLSKLPIEYPNNGIVVTRDFLQKNRDTVKRFLKAWVEGTKIFKTDKNFSIRVLQKHLKTNDREILAKSYELYTPVFEKLPRANREGIMFSLKRIAERDPQALKLNPDDFIDNSILLELEKEGFIDQIYARQTKKGK